ncbi:unnamed protein product [Rotaria sp. Silwood2]|nr:unnamed protein product [Rotaria sp. Silwood2]
MKFDQLPNEILIECFEYLSALDILYSFDQLNYRSHTLVESISLHLNLHHKNKLLFDQFCHQMLFNPQMKNQIISLKLSNKNTCGQLNVFLSFFSISEFSQLRSITLIDLDYNRTQQIESIILLLFDFANVYSNELTDETCNVLSKLVPSKIQMKLTSNLNSNSTSIHKTTTITSLTVFQCSLDDLWQVFKYTPNLEYLHIKILCNSSSINDELDVISAYAFYLKQLVVDYSTANFQIFELLLQQTPNLKILTIDVEYQIDIIDGERWQNLIESSLHHLDIFNFKFDVGIRGDYDVILNKFHQFQTDFWHKQHYWYTNCQFNSHAAFIYTITYVWNRYVLQSDTKRYGIKLMNNSKIFENVTNLILFSNILDNKSEYYYFQNVTSLTLYKESNLFKKLDFNLKPEDTVFESLKMIINLSNLKHLDIKSMHNIISSIKLLEILKQAPQLSSIAINKSTLILFLINHELCQYLNKMINVLDIDDDYNDDSIKSDELNKLSKIFSNIEKLQCCTNEMNTCLFILNHMPKLKHVEIRSLSSFSRDTSAWLKMIASKSNINCILKQYDQDADD